MKNSFVLLLSVLGLFLVSCGELPASTPSTTATSVVQSTQAPPKPKSVKQQLEDIVQNADHFDEHAVAFLVGNGFLIVENYNQLNAASNDLLIENFKQDCYNLERAIWTSSVSKHLSQVEVKFEMDTQDQYGKVTPNDVVGSCILTQKTAALFQWDHLQADDTWNIYDSTYLAPFLTQ